MFTLGARHGGRVEPPHLGNYRVHRGAGDGRSAVGAAVIARLEDRRHLGAGPTRSHGEAVAHGLGHGDDVGDDAGVLETEPLTGAREAGLHLVDHHQHSALVAQLPNAPQIFRGGGNDAALTLDRLDEHGRARSIDRRPQRVEVPERHVTKPVGHGLERFVLGGLAGGGQRGQGATVKTAQRADHHVPPATAELARQLDGGLVRFGTAVAEEHLTADTGGLAQQGVHRDGGRGGRVVGEEIADVNEPIHLFAHGGGDDRIRVSERHHGDTRQEIQVSLARRVEQFGSAPPLEHDGRRSEDRHERTPVEAAGVESVRTHDGTFL